MRNAYSSLLAALRRSADRPFYPVVAGGVAFADYFVPGSPSNTLLVASVLPNPRRWAVLGLTFAIGCAGGAFALAVLLGSFGDPVVEWIAASEGAGLWRRIEGFVEAYGLLALAGLALSPFPVRIAVAVLALAGFSPLLLGAIVLGGRLPLYALIAWLAARAPGVLARLRLPGARSPGASSEGEGK